MSQRNHMMCYVSWNFVNFCTTVWDTANEKVCNRWITTKLTQGYRKWHNISLPVSSKDVSILHRFCLRYYHTYSVHDWLWPLEVLQFRYNNWKYRPCVNISHMMHTILEVWKIAKFQTAKGTFKVSHDFLLACHCNCVSILYHFLDIITYVPKYNKVLWPLAHPKKVVSRRREADI